MTASCKLLCIGDIHLGRSPSRLPEDLLAELGRARAELGPAAALERCVQLALDERVDAVLFAGDVVEAEEDFFEAYPRLKRSVERLVEAGIDAVAVAGNHDVRVLPRLADEVPGLTLLGRGGRWATHLVRRGGEAVLRVVGWSFHERRVVVSPLASYPRAWDARRFEDDGPDSLPTVGLLHADLDAHGSAYAPVARVELAERALEGWLVGHVHAPDRERLSAAVPIGYLGSLTGLDPGEPGVRGPWLGRLESRALRLEQVPLAPLRYERRDVAIDDVHAEDELEPALLRAVRAAHAELAPTLGEAAAVALRLRLVGARRFERAALAERLQRAVARDGAPGLRERCDDVSYFVEHATDDTRPARDLAALAESTDPVGLVARRVLALEAQDAKGRELVERALAALAGSARVNHPSLSCVAVERRAPGEVRALLLRVARQALEELLAQREEAPLRASVEERSEAPA